MAKTKKKSKKSVNGTASSNGSKPELVEPNGAFGQHNANDPMVRFAVFAEGIYPYQWKMKRSEYDAKKAELQVELLKMQNWVRDTGQRVVILFEGRDAAGKGGTIKRFMEHMNPRSARVVALPAPTEAEKSQWFFQRYAAHLPSAGEIVMFDRSWYNRAGVEKVMGFCTPSEYLQFTRQAPAFEKMLVDSGIRLVKLYFSVGRNEQRRRFNARINSPLKRWKLSSVDRASLDKWDEYTEAKRLMFFHTHTADTPWHVIKSDDKKRARINAMRLVLTLLPYPDKDLDVARPPDRLIVGSAGDVLEADELPQALRTELSAETNPPVKRPKKSEPVS